MDFVSTYGDWSLLIILGCVFFPRITMLFIGVPFNLLTIIGWVFLPYFLVAMAATNMFSETDPILVICAWIRFFISIISSDEES